MHLAGCDFCSIKGLGSERTCARKDLRNYEAIFEEYSTMLLVEQLLFFSCLTILIPQILGCFRMSLAHMLESRLSVVLLFFILFIFIAGSPFLAVTRFLVRPGDDFLGLLLEIISKSLGFIDCIGGLLYFVASRQSGCQKDAYQKNK